MIAGLFRRRWSVRVGLGLICLAAIAGWILTPFLSPRPPKFARLGLLCHFCTEGSTSADVLPETGTAVFLDTLRKLGWVEGENVELEWRATAGNVERLAELAAELVALEPDLLISWGGTPPALALQRATSSIPIIFTQVGDPVGSGLVASISHPGGGLTGTTNFSPELSAKRLQLLQEAVPGAKRVDVVWNFGNPVIGPDWSETRRAAERLGIMLQAHDARDAAQIEAAFERIAFAVATEKQPPEALLVGGDSLFIFNRERIVALVDRTGLPALYANSSFTKVVPTGGLMYFGIHAGDLGRRSAHQADKILRGTPPSELPVELPSTFELVINLSAARHIRLEIPQSLLDQATGVLP